MPKFRMLSVGDEGHISFQCEACCGNQDETSFDTYNRPYQTKILNPGECAFCQATGFHPNRPGHLCDECGGTGVCHFCQGQSFRDWSDLPGDEQEEWLNVWEVYGNKPLHYLALSSLYRNW